MNDLTFAATLFSVCALLVVAVFVEATGVSRHAVKSAGGAASAHQYVASVQPRRDCALVASATVVR